MTRKNRLSAIREGFCRGFWNFRGFLRVPSALLAVMILLAFALTAGCGWANTDAADSSTEGAGDGATDHAASKEATAGDALWFSWQGGSGRVRMACREVTSGEYGQETAVILFSSPNYTQVKAGEESISPEEGENGGDSAFRIPVTENTPLSITATTVAMSAPHEIEYTIFVGTKENASAFGGTLSRVGDLSALQKTEAGTSGGSGAPGGKNQNAFGDPPEIPGLSLEQAELPEDAENFRIDRYDGGISLIRSRDSSILVVPGGGDALPEEARDHLPGGVAVIRQNPPEIYAAASSVPSFFDALGAMDSVAMSSLPRDSWEIDAPKEAYDRGTLTYAGKYSAPDYELLTSRGCGLAIESTMINHSPEVREMLEKLGIPVLVDSSSYEATALGRMEWIRVYGAILGKDDEAERFYHGEKEKAESAENAAVSGQAGKPSAVFFTVLQNGQVSVRHGDDLVADMIRKAGGTSLFDDLTPSGQENATKLTMEEFYSRAKDADFLFYDSVLGGEIASRDDLLGKSPLFADFSAVKAGRVYQADSSWYQSSAIMAEMTGDFQKVFSGNDGDQMVFLRHVETN